MWHGSLNTTGQTKPASLGGILTSAPAACSWGPNRTDTFIRGIDNTMYHKYFDGTKWSEWKNLGGELASAPGCTGVKG